MSATYFGLICPQCNAAYPLGTESKRDWRYSIGDLRHLLNGIRELRCIRCGAATAFHDFVTWTPSEGYTAAQIAVAGTHVYRTAAPKA